MSEGKVTAVGITALDAADSNGLPFQLRVPVWLVPTMEFKLVSVGELRTHGIGFHVPPSHDTYHAAYAAGNDTTTTNLPFELLSDTTSGYAVWDPAQCCGAKEIHEHYRRIELRAKAD